MAKFNHRTMLFDSQMIAYVLGGVLLGYFVALSIQWPLIPVAIAGGLLGLVIRFSQ